MNLLEELINIFLPKCCVLCKRTLNSENNRHLCNFCWNNFQPILGLFCQKCGKPLPEGGAHCYFCLHSDVSKKHFEHIRAAGVYAGVLKEVIHKFKYQGKDFLSSGLGEFLIQQSNDKLNWAEVDIIVPVPLHKKNKHKRGYNQAELLAEKVALHFKKVVVSKNLIRVRKTEAQMQLPREKRLTNLTDAFAISDKLIFKDKNVLLIDDVCTTGSTIEECAKTLKKVGVRKIWGLVLAHGA